MHRRARARKSGNYNASRSEVARAIRELPPASLLACSLARSLALGAGSRGKRSSVAESVSKRDSAKIPYPRVETRTFHVLIKFD